MRLLVNRIFRLKCYYCGRSYVTLNPSVARDACDFSVAGDAFDLSVADDARFAIVHNRALQACVMLLDHSDQAVYVAVMKVILHVLQPNLNVLRLLHTWI
jgi:hypothetical protein